MWKSLDWKMMAHVPLVAVGLIAVWATRLVPDSNIGFRIFIDLVFFISGFLLLAAIGLVRKCLVLDKRGCTLTIYSELLFIRQLVREIGGQDLFEVVIECKKSAPDSTGVLGDMGITSVVVKYADSGEIGALQYWKSSRAEKIFAEVQNELCSMN